MWYTDEINKIKQEIILLTNDKSYSIKLNELEKEVSVYKNLRIEYDNYERNKIKIDMRLEVEQKELEISRKQIKLDNYENNKEIRGKSKNR